jgi:uncharacterized protein YuzE
MKQPKINYFEKNDVLHLLIASGKEQSSFELASGVTVELDGEGNLIGVEILNASAFLRDTILESAQAKLGSVFRSATANNS